jgi:TonB C terminal
VPNQPTRISIWTNEAPPREATSRHSVSSTRIARMLRGGVVTAICLVAHGLVFTTMMWSAGAPTAPRDELPARVSVASEAAQVDIEWIVLDPEALSDPSRPKRELPVNHFQRVDVRKALAQVAVLIPDVDLPPTPDATVADAGRLSKMYGRYVGQITARVDRAWQRPRTPIGGDSFSCRARVTQDVMGNVLEVKVEQCNGDSRWQLSLVHAIQTASPLPAPPDPDVFSRTLHLGFSAEAYSPQSPADQYEPEAVAALAKATQDTQRAKDALIHIGDSSSSGVIKLNITGEHMTIEKQESMVGVGTASNAPQ